MDEAQWDRFGETVLASSLFGGLAEGEARAIVGCLNARVRTLEKGEALFRAGEPISDVGLVLEGAVTLVKEDFWGNRSIVAKVGRTGVFAEAFACLPGTPADVSAVAAERCTVLLMDLGRIVGQCSSACVFHARLVRNLLTVLAQRSTGLVAKIEHVSKRTTRAKLLSFLSAQAQRAGSSTFTIPYNRQELADYLFVDRSAMSTELGKLKAEGLLDLSGSTFKLLANAEA